MQPCQSSDIDVAAASVLLLLLLLLTRSSVCLGHCGKGVQVVGCVQGVLLGGVTGFVAVVGDDLQILVSRNAATSRTRDIQR